MEEEQRIADQLAEKELIEVDERQGEFVISVLGEVNTKCHKIYDPQITVVTSDGSVESQRSYSES